MMFRNFWLLSDISFLFIEGIVEFWFVKFMKFFIKGCIFLNKVCKVCVDMIVFFNGLLSI